ncbi:MAG: hypothetical protein [Caudoviricetes sp.]|nr:MAG: hypothetical protein [Caudoviricetes sp.]
MPCPMKMPSNKTPVRIPSDAMTSFGNSMCSPPPAARLGGFLCAVLAAAQKLVHRHAEVISHALCTLNGRGAHAPGINTFLPQAARTLNIREGYIALMAQPFDVVQQITTSCSFFVDRLPQICYNELAGTK